MIIICEESEISLFQRTRKDSTQEKIASQFSCLYNVPNTNLLSYKEGGPTKKRRRITYLDGLPPDEELRQTPAEADKDLSL
jgi:hypothetical protein